MSRLVKSGTAVALALMTSSAFAIDTTNALLEVDGAETAIIAVGGALLVLAAVSMAYRWVKATFF